jgi:membrane associated rhomboid family serine protease
VGIYERDYYRQGRGGFSFPTPQSAVAAIVVVNVFVYVLELLAGLDAQGNNPVVHWLEMTVTPISHHDTICRPWMWWQFITYGFTHDWHSWQHIAFNMLALVFLGRDVEDWYGTKEFLRLYMVMLVFAGLTTTLFGYVAGTPMSCIGASGAVTGVVILYALNFPRRTLLVGFLIPVPAWLVGVGMIAYDILGASGHGGDEHIGHSAHLGGAAFALMYFFQRWNLGRLSFGNFSWMRLPQRPSLRIHEPDLDFKEPPADDEVDRILEKIHREGEASLTRKERQILETASREYQRRRHPP